MGEYNGVVGGVSSMVTDGFRAWWDGAANTISGYQADESLTVREAYKRVLDWRVVERAVFVDSFGTGQLVIDPTRKAVVRADQGKILGVHSESYGIVQNETLEDFCKALKTIGDVFVKSAGTLYDDKVAWILVKLGEDKHFSDGDETLQKYLLVATSHDGSTALCARATNVRVECMNTFDWAMSKDSALVSLRHTRNVQDYIPQARRTLEVAYNHYAAIDAEIEELMQVMHTRKQFTDELVPALIGEVPKEDASKRTHTLYENRKDGLIAAWERPDQANIAGTGWGSIMAVNSWENWGQTVRGTTRPEAQARRALRGDYPLTSKARKLVLA